MDDDFMKLPNCPFDVSYELVTPEMAKRWLAESNTHNRSLRAVTTETFAADMATNRWSANHQALAFAVGGALIDGQHRLAGVELSGKAQWFLIARDVPVRIGDVLAEVGETIDRGNQRSLADLLVLDHNLPKSEANVIAAATIHIARLCVRFPDMQTKKASMPQTVEMLGLFRDELRWMVAERPVTTGLRMVPVMATLAFARACWPAGALSFITALKSASSGGVSGILRDALLRGLFQGGSISAKIALSQSVLACVLAHMNSRSMTALPSASEGEKALAMARAAAQERVERVEALFPLTRPDRFGKRVQAVTVVAPAPVSSREPVPDAPPPKPKLGSAAARFLEKTGGLRK